MKRPVQIFAALLTAVLAACSQPTDESLAPGVVELTSGTSFGMCAGYCLTELVIESQAVRFTERSHPIAPLPERTRTLPLSPDDAEQISALVDVAEIERLEGVHGCPDCADGGAEWIQIRTSDGTVRVTFEYGAVLPGIAQLQAALRAQRERFPR
jgi:hypothetical protein